MKILMRGFTVGNYKSFDSPQTISFATSRVTKHPSHVIELTKTKLLKSAMVFGANASEKSNLIKAIKFSTQIIRQDLDYVNLVKQNFRIKASSYTEPAVFQYDFIVNEQEYLYGFTISYDQQIISNEWLTKVLGDKEFTIFDRQIDDNLNSTIYSDYQKKVMTNFFLI